MEIVSKKRNGYAVSLFMQFLDIPDTQISSIRNGPYWKILESVAPTLAYDHEFILGEDMSVPKERVKQLNIPALIMSGTAGNSFMRITASTLSNAIPNSRLLTLEGQTHSVTPYKLAPVLIDFFNS